MASLAVWVVFWHYKSLHLAVLSLFLSLSVHTLNCWIHDCMVFVWLSCFVAYKDATVDLGNGILNKDFEWHYIVITFVYFVCYAFPFLLVLNSSFVNITDFILGELQYLIFTKSKLLSSCSCSSGQGFYLNGPHALPCHSLIISGPAAFSVPACFTLHLTLLQQPNIFPYAWYCLRGCPVPQYLQLLIILFFIWLTLSHLCLSHLIESKTLSSLIWSSTLFALSHPLPSEPIIIFGHWWPHWYLLVLLVPLISQLSQFHHLSHCSVSVQSYSWYSQSAALVCNLPIHSMADLWVSLLSYSIVVLALFGYCAI